LDLVKTWIEENDPESSRRINQENFRRISREGELEKLKRQKNFQDSCPHLLGCTGTSVSTPPPNWPKFDKVLGAFFGQKLSTGELIGICCYCRKKISSIEPEDSKYFSEDSGIQWFNLNKNAKVNSNWVETGEDFIEFPNKIVTVNPDILTKEQIISICKQDIHG